MRERQFGLPLQNPGPPSGVLRLIAYAGSATAALVGLVMLVGWLAGLPLEMNCGPDLRMKPVTALAVVLIAAATFPQFWLAPPWRIAIGVIAALLGASSLIRKFSGLDFRLESWLAPADVTPGTAFVDFLISPATALARSAGRDCCCPSANALEARSESKSRRKGKTAATGKCAWSVKVKSRRESQGESGATLAFAHTQNVRQ